MAQRILLSWSGGKDGAMTLYELARDRRYRVAGLLTTVTEGYERVSMHGVRRELLRRQAHSLGVALHEVRIPRDADNRRYEAALSAALAEHRAQGIDTVAYGDLFLRDVREYRERVCARAGVRCLFPVWARDTHAFAKAFIDLGFKAVLVCVDPTALDASFAGRAFDRDLLADLPASADPCGENGEFHTFVFDGPLFCVPVGARRGDVVERGGFVFCDLLPAEHALY